MSEISHVIIIIHGIRTRAEWSSMAAQILTSQSDDLNVHPISFGYFDLFRFWFPFLTRNGPIKRVERELRTAIKKYPKAKISVIAHSFGTYAISNVLIKYPDITLEYLVLCGSIIKPDYDWGRIKSQIKSTIVNECGSRDVWPVLAGSTTWGYGSSGTFGFGNVEVIDRHHELSHSGFLTKEFVRKFWVPLFVNNKVIASKWDQTLKKTPGYFQIFSIPFQWIILLFIFILILLAVRITPRINEQGLTLAFVSDYVAKLAVDEDGKELARAFARDVQDVAFMSLPITGDTISTEKLFLERISIAFIEGPNSIIKLQSFELPSGAIQIRGQSNDYTDHGEGFIAKTWAYIQENNTYMRVNHVNNGIESKWIIKPSKNKRHFFLIALYEDSKLLHDGGAYAGIELNDLAGEIGEISVVVSAYSAEVYIKSAFMFLPRSPLEFFIVPEKNSTTILNPNKLIKERYSAIVDILKEESEKVTLHEKLMLQKLIKNWTEAISHEIHWDGKNYINIKGDMFIGLAGVIKKPL